LEKPDSQDLDSHPVADKGEVVSPVPIIDVGDLRIDQASDAIEEIARACSDWGFFQVINHGIDDELINNIWRNARHFFGQSIEDKQSILRSRENPWGYYDIELTKNKRDKKEVFDFTTEGSDPIYHAENRWPSDIGSFRSTMLDYLEACTGLSHRLLQAFCMGLDLPADYLNDNFAPEHTGFVRLNYFPVKDPAAGRSTDDLPDAGFGIHHHTDAGALTVLLQDDVGGLQVHRNGRWHDIPPVEGALVINTGDMMQVWSNDAYRAPAHRVLAMENYDRYSIPFFFNPAADARVSPLPTVVSDSRPSAYRAIEWAEFRGKRSDGDYADYGTEVQISQYRL
jgi:isopenicillin N synthase-like dioxygenase